MRSKPLMRTDLLVAVWVPLAVACVPPKWIFNLSNWDLLAVVVWATIQSHGGVGEQMGRNGNVQESLWKSNPSTLTPPLSPISTMGHRRQL
ncbi:hypothetical protein L6452_40524 [Arctium lappa]|uniref:Uncharacterized protein n=1 Tax=Arctium lappa TaxID=4217 RepID=A0ACB8XLL7_ARCLA|nr:hypothetical protein L6452_40524 [Arctium lappa]